MKTCTKCGEELPDEQFSRYGNGKRRAQCKSCANAQDRQRYAANSEKRRASARAWQKKNPDKVKSIKQAYYERHRVKIIARVRAGRIKRAFAALRKSRHV